MQYTILVRRRTALTLETVRREFCNGLLEHDDLLTTLLAEYGNDPDIRIQGSSRYCLYKREDETKWPIWLIG